MCSGVLEFQEKCSISLFDKIAPCTRISCTRICVEYPITPKCDLIARGKSHRQVLPLKRDNFFQVAVKSALVDRINFTASTEFR